MNIAILPKSLKVSQLIKLCLICGISIFYQSRLFLKEAEQEPPGRSEGENKEKASLNLPLPARF